MSSAPAGWYMDPRTPGVARYWDGAAWSAPDAGPTAAFQGSTQRADPSTPSVAAAPSSVATAPSAEWSVVAPQALRSFGAVPASHAAIGPVSTNDERVAYTEPPPHSYNPVTSVLRRTPGWVKVAVVFGSIAIGFGARWVFTMFLAAD
jgi:hypothetical protein